MKIDINEEIKHMAAAPQANYSAKASGVKAASDNNDFGAVFENGVTERFIENAISEGSEALDKADSAHSRHTQKQLAAMANTMTEDDLCQIKEETDNLEDEDINTIVTVQEKIRMQLSAYCDGFNSGMVEEFSEEELAAIDSMKGNAAVWAKKLKEADIPVTKDNLEDIRYALELAGKIPEISDGVMEYFIKNPNKEITIESLYIASYTSGNYMSSREGSYYSLQAGGYLAQNTTGGDLGKIMPQIENLLSNNGITVDEGILENVKWLYDNQLPINGDTISCLEDLKQLEMPVDEGELLQRIADAMYEGKLPMEASLTGDNLKDLAKKASDIINIIANVTDEQLKAAIASEEGELTISALEQAAAGNDTAGNAALISDTDIRFITARRQLEEIRLQMTIQSVAAMEKQGISVDVTGFSELVEHLKELENSYKASLFSAMGASGTEENIELYTSVNKTIDIIKNSPAHLVGKVAFSEEDVILGQMEKEGLALAEKYKSAETAYETVMTKPRADMGDSIKTAFRNVDDILKSMDLEINAYNQRAVRILGYNSMEITEENIARVKTVDIQLNNMLSHMTPSSVIRMIRENYNPMQAALPELNDKLQSYEEAGFASEDRYSEFLWKMEQKKEITSDERESFIGIYRLINQIEKSDGALVGALVSRGADVTMENLLSASRTRKRGAVDYTVNDEFSGVDGKNSADISKQIEKGFLNDGGGYYGVLAKNTLENMNITALHNSVNDGSLADMTFEQFAQLMEDTKDADGSDNQYSGQQLDIMRQISDTENQVLSMLSDYDIPVSINNIAAAEAFMENPGNWMKQLLKKDTAGRESGKLENSAESKIFAKAENLIDSLTDKASIQASYRDFANEAAKTIKENIIEENDTYIDVRTMKLLNCQLNIASSMAREEMYQIPVMIGEEVAAINLRFRYNTGEENKVGVSMESGVYGAVEGTFTIKSGQVNGYIMSASSEGMAYLQETMKVFTKALSDTAQLEMGNMSIVQNNDIHSTDIFLNSNKKINDTGNKLKNNSADSDKSGSRELYQLAKIFIETVKTTLA